MAFYEGLPGPNFKEINLKNGDEGGLLRFHGTTTITPAGTTGPVAYVKYIQDKKVLHFWDTAENRPIEPGFVNVQTIASTATLTVQDCGAILVAPTTSMTITLPAASTATEGMYYIVHTGLGNDTVKIAPSTGGINNKSSYFLTVRFERMLLVSNGSDSWIILEANNAYTNSP